MFSAYALLPRMLNHFSPYLIWTPTLSRHWHFSLTIKVEYTGSRRKIDELVWKNLPLLQSLTLRMHTLSPIEVRQCPLLGVLYGSLTRTLGPFLSLGEC